MTARSERCPRTEQLRPLFALLGLSLVSGCVQQALRTWVTTFDYAPLHEAIPMAFDWMIVTAARND